MNKSGLLAIKTLKSIWKIALFVLDAVLVIGFDKRTPSRHSALEAQILYDDGLISDSEYAKAMYHGK